MHIADFMTPPADALHAASGPVWLNSDGMVITITEIATQTLDDAINNMKFIQQATLGTPRPLLVDMTKVQSINKAAREAYVRKKEEQYITAVALVTNSAISKMVGNIFINLNQPFVPVKLFTDVDKAREWLLQYREIF